MNIHLLIFFNLNLFKLLMAKLICWHNLDQRFNIILNRFLIHFTIGG